QLRASGRLSLPSDVVVRLLAQHLQERLPRRHELPELRSRAPDVGEVHGRMDDALRAGEVVDGLAPATRFEGLHPRVGSGPRARARLVRRLRESGSAPCAQENDRQGTEPCAMVSDTNTEWAMVDGARRALVCQVQMRHGGTVTQGDSKRTGLSCRPATGYPGSHVAPFEILVVGPDPVGSAPVSSVRAGS